MQEKGTTSFTVKELSWHPTLFYAESNVYVFIRRKNEIQIVRFCGTFVNELMKYLRSNLL
jgi:hypothetical protein